MERKIDDNFFAGYVLMDLSKAFDCVLQNLLLAKLAACGFDMNFLCYIFSYLPPTPLPPPKKKYE